MVKTMKYILFCLHNKEIDKYQKRIVKDISKKFNINMTRVENIFAHFTVKYSFEANPKQLEELKKTLSKFTKIHKKQKIKVGEFDNFNKRVVFIKVNQSKNVKETISELHKELRKLKWMPWANFEKNGIHLHTTVAEESTEEIYPKIIKYLLGKEKYFDSYFNNITIMKFSTAKKPTRRWIIEKKYNLQ